MGLSNEAWESKKHETRSWQTGHRGDLVICAAKRKMTRDDLDTLYTLVEPPDSENYEIPYGCALCIVELFDCIPSSAFHGATPLPLGPREAVLGNYELGRWIWITRNLRPLSRPVPIVGHQGIWNLRQAETEAVKAALIH